jgi:hypothetical protein
VLEGELPVRQVIDERKRTDWLRDEDLSDDGPAGEVGRLLGVTFRSGFCTSPSGQRLAREILYPSSISPPAGRPLALVGEVVARAEDIRDLVVAFGLDRLLKSHEVGP